MTGAANPDPELRIPPNTYTPLGRSMFYSRLYFENYVYPNDPKRPAARTSSSSPPTAPRPATRRRRRHVDRSDHLRADAGRQLRDVPPRGAGLLARPLGGHPQGRADLHPDRQRPHHRREDDRQRDRRGGRHRAGHLRHADRHQRGQAGAGRHHRQDRPARPRSATASTTTATARSTKGFELPNVRRQHDRRLRRLHIDPDTRPIRTTCWPGRRRAQHCAVEACNCLDDNCNGQVDEGLPAQRLRPALRLRGAARDVRRPRQRLRRRHRRRLHASAPSCINNGVGACRRGGILACNADGTGTFCDAPTVTPQHRGLQRHRRQLQRQIDEGHAARRRRGLRQRPRHLPVGDVRLHERPAGVQRDQHAAGRDLQRHRRQLRRRHRQRQLPADRPDLPLPGPDPGAGRRRQHLQGRPPRLPRHAGLRRARAACCRRPRSATARTTTATA